MIYIWRATCLKQYQDGWIIVTATSVEAAREVARAEMTAWCCTEDAPYFFYPDEFYSEEREQFWAKFNDDIAKEPQVAKAQFINGSA